MDTCKVIAAIFWILDNGAKWKDLPRHFASRSATHAYFQRWTIDGAFETIMRDAGDLVEGRGGTGCTSASLMAPSVKRVAGATASASTKSEMAWIIIA